MNRPPRNILIVEDCVDQAENLAFILRQMGHAAYHSPTALGGRAVAEVHPPDAVLLDLVLPGGGSRDFLAWLRGRPETAGVPVVVTTGLPGRETADLRGLPGVTVLTKPVDVPVLLGALGVEGPKP